MKSPAWLISDAEEDGESRMVSVRSQIGAMASVTGEEIPPMMMPTSSCSISSSVTCRARSSLVCVVAVDQLDLAAANAAGGVDLLGGEIEALLDLLAVGGQRCRSGR